MKYFLIRYQFKNGSRDEWHREIERFIRALENDPVLSGKISYRSMKGRDGSEYFHLAEAADDQAIKELGERDYFVHYTEKTELVSGGGVEVLPLEMIAQTEPRAYTRS
jgi:hypothetical protein